MEKTETTVCVIFAQEYTMNQNRFLLFVGYRFFLLLTNQSSEYKRFFLQSAIRVFSQVMIRKAGNGVNILPSVLCPQRGSRHTPYFEHDIKPLTTLVLMVAYMD